jgi:hypothetical protein
MNAACNSRNIALVSRHISFPGLQVQTRRINGSTRGVGHRLSVIIGHQVLAYCLTVWLRIRPLSDQFVHQVFLRVRRAAYLREEHVSKIS